MNNDTRALLCPTHHVWQPQLARGGVGGRREESECKFSAVLSRRRSLQELRDRTLPYHRNTRRLGQHSSTHLPWNKSTTPHKLCGCAMAHITVCVALSERGVAEVR